jgi:membrane-bound lytic murein transglycosylase D
VEAGQTYFSISRLYNLTVDQLLALNQRTANDRLAVGQRLLVRRNAPAAVSTPAATPPAVRYVNHTVASGETLFRISQKYGVSTEEIQQANNMTDVTVKLGQILRIPTRTP